jgi:hypothetical protein
LRGIKRAISLCPNSVRAVMRVFPISMLLPRAVRIWITPLAAREPYSEAAAAPLTTSMLSMSSEAMSAGLEPRITPSTTYRGATVLRMLVGLRRTTRASPPPGCPLPRSTCTPDTLPWSAVAAEPVVGTGRFAALTRPTAKGTLVPAVGAVTPVTTSPSISSTDGRSRKSTVAEPPAARRTSPRLAGAYPAACATSVYAPPESPASA